MVCGVARCAEGKAYVSTFRKFIKRKENSLAEDLPEIFMDRERECPVGKVGKVVVEVTLCGYFSEHGTLLLQYVEYRVFTSR